MDMPSQKHVVVVAGAVGTGSETVLQMLGQLGYCTVDADEIAGHLTWKGNAAYDNIVQRFGDRFLDPHGELDRSSLNRAARAEPGLREEIRSILYPLVKNEVARFLEAADGNLVFVKARTPDAYGARELSDQLWMLTATEEARVSDLVKHHNLTLPLARQFVRTQPEQNPEVAHADLILDAGAPRAALWGQLMRCLDSLTPSPREATVVATPEAVEAEPAASPVTSVSRTVLVTAETPTLARPRGAEAASLRSIELKLIGREILSATFILLALAYLTSWGLLLAEYGRQHTPISAWQAVWQALIRIGQYLGSHPQTYFWAREQVPWLQLVSTTLGHSAGLLLLSMGAALLLALPLGIAAATAKSRAFSTIVMVLSVLGASTPSFLFGMLLWLANIAVHRYLNVPVLPSTGFGWDGHVIMPALVLAMRPLAQLAQVTYVSMREVLQQDYIRTGHAKGLTWRIIRDRHVLRNTLIPILTTLGTSLRFSLASLPVVEIFFRWPGVGSMLLDAIYQGTDTLVLDLILSLGLFFLLVNLLIEFSFPLIDPQLQGAPITMTKSDGQTLQESLGEIRSMLWGWYGDVRALFVRPARQNSTAASKRSMTLVLQGKRPNWVIYNVLRNPLLMASSLVLLLLLGLALFGGSLTSASPYQIHGVMAIEGEYVAPPFKPSSVFPWGTDHIGRDMQSLVLGGAQRTLSLAFFGMLARLLLGSVLGLIAGWLRGGRFDRTVTAAMGIWAAFPATLFAMIVIQGLGIQQGMWVFIVAICVVGWGEVAQFVRGQVIALKPKLFIESARTVGARADQILVRHILPNLANPLIVLAALEMGGVLMLLAELGFLNVFMGGGFRAMIGETGPMQPVVAFYSDVPEWGALIANVRAQWRNYPWMAIYPGLAVLISILACNLFGEGLRRFLEDSAVNLSRLFNRYTFTAAACLGLVIALILQSSVPLSMYRSEGFKFDAQQVLKDVQVLSSPQVQGRETGTSGATLAALYIAQRMAEIGIFPAGEHNNYYQAQIQPRLHLLGMPALALLDDSGAVLNQFRYGSDFAEIERLAYSWGDANAPVMGVAYGPVLDTAAGQPDLRNSAAANHILIIRAGDFAKVKVKQVRGILEVADEAADLGRRYVYPADPWLSGDPRPCALISPQLADRLLRTAGSSLAELDAARASLPSGETWLTAEGAHARLSVPAAHPERPEDEKYINVIGVIPGQGHFMGTEEQVIIVSAYYDGLGTDPAGTTYPGANDNASGVAAMLELARLLKASAYQPDKTVLFVAWAGGERQEGLSVVNVLNARAGASDFNVEAVLELSGIGYGTGKSISIGSDSSYRLVQLFQQAAGRYRVPTTTRGRGPHYDLPAQSMFGGRDAMTLSLSWDGSDDLAHTPGDVAALIDPAKIRSVGRAAYLTLLVLSRESEY